MTDTRKFRNGENYANTLRGWFGVRRFLRYLGRPPNGFSIHNANYYADRMPDKYVAWLAGERLVHDNKLPS